MQEKELLQFPCDFPIKVMGFADPLFAPTIGSLIKEFDPLFNPETIETPGMLRMSARWTP